MDIDERIAQFDSPVDRTGIFSMKWDVADGELPMWVADMDFRTAPAISEALAERVGNGTFGGGILNGGEGIRILPEGMPALGMILPVGGFLTLACLIAFMQWRSNKAKESKKDEKAEEVAK